MSEFISFLPPNRTRLEGALEQSIRLGKPDITMIQNLMNPETCPAHLLGWLAWAFSVDVWDATWTEAVKREVIKLSVSIHRIKGTLGSVRRILTTIGFRSDISEWFEYGGEPHTFRIDAFADDIFDAELKIDAKLHALVTELVHNVKPVRSHFTLRIGEKKGGTVTLRTGSTQKVCERRTVMPVVPTDMHTAPLSIRTAQRQSVISRHTHTFIMGDAA